jgi:hypothetical protein
MSTTWSRWVSTPRRLLTSVGVKPLPPEFDPELDRPEWGRRRFGEIINQSEQQVDRLLKAGVLDADQVSLKQRETAA